MENPDPGLNPSEALALFRYRMIAPLLDPIASEEEKTGWRRQVTSMEVAAGWESGRCDDGWHFTDLADGTDSSLLAGATREAYAR